MTYSKDCIKKAFEQSRAIVIGNAANEEILGIEDSSDILLSKLEFTDYAVIADLLNNDFEDLTKYCLFKAVRESDRDESLIIVNERYPGISFKKYFENYDGKPLTEDCFDTHNWYCKFDAFEERCLEDIAYIRENKAVPDTFLLSVSEIEGSKESYGILLDAFRHFFAADSKLLLCQNKKGSVQIYEFTEQGVVFVCRLSSNEFYKTVTGKNKKPFRKIQTKLVNTARRIGYSDWYVRVVHARLIKLPIYRKIIHKVYVKANNTQN